MAKTATSRSRLPAAALGGAQQIGAVYAKAIIAAADKAGQTAALLAELDSLETDVLDPLPAFEKVLASALVSADEKIGLLDRALAKQASPLLLTFLKVLARHGRLGVLRAIRREAHQLYDKARGHFEVEVITATPLADGLADRIKEHLRGMLGGEPDLVPVTDPDVIGGLVLRVGDTVYDGSVATRLSRVRAQMIHRSIDEIQRRRDRFSHSD